MHQEDDQGTTIRRQCTFANNDTGITDFIHPKDQTKRKKLQEP